MPHFSASMGITPALCAASKTNRIPCFRQISATSCAGSTVPQTLLACVMTTSLVWGSMSFSTSFGLSVPSIAHLAREKVIPRCASWVKGRMIALCSMLLTMTWSPGLRYPLRTRFSASVTLRVKTTCEGSLAPKSLARRSRVSNTRSSTSNAVEYSPRPRFVPALVM